MKYYLAFMVMVRGLTVSAFGRVTVRTPCLHLIDYEVLLDLLLMSLGSLFLWEQEWSLAYKQLR
jgi:hypothetical protein